MDSLNKPNKKRRRRGNISSETEVSLSHDRKRQIVNEECTSSSGEDDIKMFDEEKKTVEDDLARELFEQKLIQKHKEMVNKSFASVRQSTLMEEEVQEEKESSDEFDFRKTDLFSILLGIEKKVTTPYWCQSTNKEEKKLKKILEGGKLQERRNSPRGY
ncbi:protein GrpE-like [Diorhabda sublineata]|uniref:protein GrpE-like n=1 Tax=Diorhabda sublineata TaxID=1163346 RepID=UPI0024E070B6|nr:protein GrpE-like [Diorhabda sublineata]XP_056647427.1 protein GrpE-like [Diorhabda sublineata]